MGNLYYIEKVLILSLSLIRNLGSNCEVVDYSNRFFTLYQGSIVY